jgi:hypothetical protein
LLETKTAHPRRIKEKYMKYAKILGLAAMALAALMAMAGTASATTLTSPQNTTFTGTIKAEAESTVILTSVFGGFGAVSCKKSNVEGPVSSHGAGVTVSGSINVLTFGECSNPVTVINKGSLEVHNLNSNEANLTGKGQTVTIHETVFGTCHFITNAATGTGLGTLTLTPKTGGNATLDIKASIPSENGCGTGTWEGSYKVTSPSTLYVDA